MHLRSLLLALAACPLLLSIQEPSPEDHGTREIRGWTVRVHPELQGARKELGERVLTLLDHKLFDICRAIPGPALTEFKKVTIWMEVDDALAPGGVYHPSRNWLAERGHDPRLAECVQFGNAENFLSWSHSQPWMVLHELAHAYHHQVLGHDDERVIAAYRAARESGGYEEVLRYSGKRERAYSLNNEQEYFAEISEAYFGVNDYFPFVRAEVREFDATGFEMAKGVWGR